MKQEQKAMTKRKNKRQAQNTGTKANTDRKQRRQAQKPRKKAKTRTESKNLRRSEEPIA